MRASFRAPSVDSVAVDVPPYRGKRYLEVAAYAAALTTALGGEVAWTFSSREAATAVRQLESAGWAIVARPSKRDPRCRAVRPEIVELPVASAFTTSVLGTEVTFAADFGVFSPDEIDAGSRLLLESAASGGAVDEVADIGVGYGALALSLCAAGVAQHARSVPMSTRSRSGLQRPTPPRSDAHSIRFSPMIARSIRPTPLTICNIPTHIPRAESEQFMDALSARAERARLVVVVHAGLADRYERALGDRGVHAARVPGPEHCVFDTAG